MRGRVSSGRRASSRTSSLGRPSATAKPSNRVSESANWNLPSPAGPSRWASSTVASTPLIVRAANAMSRQPVFEASTRANDGGV